MSASLMPLAIQRLSSLKSSAEILPDAQAQGTWSTIQGLPGRKSPIMSVNQKHPITKDKKKKITKLYKEKRCIRKKMYRTSSSWSYLAHLNHHEWNVREWNDKTVFCQRNDSKETKKILELKKVSFWNNPEDVCNTPLAQIGILKYTDRNTARTNWKI